jgi:hypothetical protein
MPSTRILILIALILGALVAGSFLLPLGDENRKGFLEPGRVPPDPPPVRPGRAGEDSVTGVAHWFSDLKKKFGPRSSRQFSDEGNEITARKGGSQAVFKSGHSVVESLMVFGAIDPVPKEMGFLSAGLGVVKKSKFDELYRKYPDFKKCQKRAIQSSYTIALVTNNSQVEAKIKDVLRRWRTQSPVPIRLSGATVDPVRMTYEGMEVKLSAIFTHYYLVTEIEILENVPGVNPP